MSCRNTTGQSGASDQHALPSGCVVCGANDWIRLHSVLRRCRACEFVSADMTVDQATLSQLYEEPYFRGNEYGDYLADRKVHRRNFVRRLSELRRIVSDFRSLFEVGCAYGLWLELLTENGIECAGVDVSGVPVQYAVEELRQNAISGDFLAIDVESGRFDVFCMWDTIEHLARPDLYVERVFELLAAGGTLVFTTGDIGSRYARWRGGHWRMIHPPTHLHYFSRGTARRLLERHGFCDVQFQSIAVYRNLHSVLGSLAALHRGFAGSMAKWLHGILPRVIQERCGTWTNLGDIMLVSAKRPAHPGL